MRLLNLAPAALLAVLALPVGAQKPTPSTPARSTALPVAPGARVRISATTLVAPLIGNFLEMRGDTAVFIEAGAGRGIWTLTTDQITRLEISKGDAHFNRRPMLKGAAIGAGAGTLLFWGATGLIHPSDNSRQFNRGSTAAAGLVVGGIVGAFVGSRIASEGWMKVPLPGRVSVVPTLRDGRNGMALQLGFSF